MTNAEKIKWLEEAAKRWCRYAAAIPADQFEHRDRHFGHAKWYVAHARRLKSEARVRPKRKADP